MSPHPEIVDAVDTLQEIFGILAEDVELARQHGQQNPTAFAYRTLLRTHFALIEGLSFQLRRVAGIVDKHYPGRLAASEAFLLQDVRPSLKDNGEAHTVKHFEKTVPLAIFSIRSYAKVYGVVAPFNEDDPGYKAFKSLATIRNGLMHPKCKADLKQTDTQMQEATKAAAWWKETIIKLIDDAKAESEE